METNIDVLCLSATPIPRTLNLSLTSLRDISLIETPPKDRLAIHTVVTPLNAKLIASAVKTELARRGQVYYIHNRIEDIDSVARMIEKFIPQVRVAVIHGKMSSSSMERRMIDFINQKYNVLVSTTIIENGIDILGTGDMGIGNTTPSAAIGVVITGSDLKAMVGRGTGVDDEGLARKQDAIQRGIQVNRPNQDDGLDVLSKLGGFEIGGIAGSVLAGAYHRRPVVVDGFISTAGALIAHSLCPAVADYMFSGHRSEEPGHRAMLNYLKLEPILDLGMRLGEGTGGALAMSIMEGAARVFTNVLTFAEAGVADKET